MAGHSLADCILRLRTLDDNAITQEQQKQLSQKASDNKILLSTVPRKNQIAYLEKQIALLETKQYRINKAATAIMNTPSAVHITAKEKNVDTSLSQTPPLFNQIKAFFNPKSKAQLRKNIIQNYYNFVATMQNILTTGKIPTAITERITVVDDSALNVIKSIAKHTVDFNKIINDIFYQKNPRYKYQDMLQYLTDDKGKVLPNVVAAISAGTYKWQATRAGALLQNDDATIRKIFSLDKEQPIPSDAYEIAQSMGTSQTMLVEYLGDAIYPLLGISPNQKGDRLAEQRLRNSLGMMAIGVLETQGILKRTRYFTGVRINENTNKIFHTSKEEIFGMDWLHKRMHLDTILTNRPILAENTLKILQDEQGNKVKVRYKTVNYYTVNTQQKQGKIELVPHLQHIIDTYAKSPHTWSEMYEGERNQEWYSFEPFKHDPDTPLVSQDGEYTSTLEETKRLQTYMDTPQEVIGSVLNILQLFPENFRNILFGIVDPKTQQILKQKSIAGKNLGIKRDWKSTINMLIDMQKQPAGYKTKFFIKSFFIGNGRAHMTGPINPQGSLMHRNFFMPADAKTVNITPDTTSRSFVKFKMAVAFAFGLEYSKEGSLGKLMQVFEEKLQEPEIHNAITLLQKIIKGKDIDTLDPKQFMLLRKELTAKDFETIIAGVKAGGEGVHSLRGLLDYAKYLNAHEAFKTDKSVRFSTNLMLEVDGLSNGPMLGILNFLNKKTNSLELNKIMRNAGWEFQIGQKSVEAVLATKLNHDIYMNTAFAWQSQLYTIRQKAAYSNDLSTVAKIDAVTSLIGNLTEEDGSVGSGMRKLAKPATMTTIFGVGAKKLVKAFAYNTVIQEGILDQIQKAVESNASDRIKILTTINEAVKTLTGKPAFIYDIDQLTDKYLLEYKLNETQQYAIYNHIVDNHGFALTQGIKDVFGTFMKTRQKINTTVAMATHMYNQVLKAFLEKEQAKQPGIPLTLEQYNAVVSSVKAALPTMKTATGGVMHLTKISRTREYEYGSEQNKTKVSFKKHKSGLKIPYIQHTASEFNGREDPGVRAPIMGIHNTDSFIANIVSALTDIPILNVFDGFFASLNDIEAVAQNANKALLEVSSKQHVAQAIHYGSINAFNNSLDLLQNNGFTQNEIDQIKIQVAIQTGLVEATEKNKALKTLNAHIFSSKNAADTARTLKTSFLSTVTGVNHYNMLNGTAYTGRRGVQSIAGTAVTDLDAVHQQRVQEQANINKVIKEDTANTIAAIQKNEAEHAAKEIDISDLAGIPSEDDENFATAVAELNAEDLIQLAEEAGITGSKGTASTDIFADTIAFSAAKEVSETNALDIYNLIKARSNSDIRISKAHDLHLQHIINDIIVKAITPLQHKIDMFIADSAELDPQGLFRPMQGENHQIYIINQIGIAKAKRNHLINKIRMSTGEVYAHELVHPIIDKGLTLSNDLTAKLQVLFEYTKRELGSEGWKAFLSNPENASAADIEAAKERYKYIFESSSVYVEYEHNPVTNKKTEHKYSNHLTEFLAFGLTNEHFVNTLRDMIVTKNRIPVFKKATWKDIKSTNIQATLLNFFNRIMNVLYSNINLGKPVSNVAQEIEDLTMQLAGIQQEQQSKLYKFFAKDRIRYGKACTYCNTYIKKAFNTWPVLKSAAGAKHLATMLYNSDNRIGEQFRKQVNKWYRLDYGLLHSIVNEVSNGKREAIPITDLLTKREIIIDTAQENLIAMQLAAFKSNFKRELDSPTKAAIMRAGIKPDLVALMPSFKIEGILDVLKDASTLAEAITGIKNKLKNNPNIDPDTFHYYIKSIEALAFHMITRRAREHSRVRPNAEFIARLYDTHKKVLSRADAAEITELIDQLTSLYALQHTSENDRAILAALIEEDSNAVVNVFNAHGLIQKELKEGEYKNNPFQFRKGHTKIITNNAHAVFYGTEDETEHYAKMSFTRSATPINRDALDSGAATTPIYLFYGKNLGRGNDYVHGVVSSIDSDSPVLPGLSLSQIYEGDWQTAAQVRDAKRQQIKDMFSSTYLPETGEGNNLIPQYDRQGKLIDYYYILDEETLNTSLDQHQEYDTILSATRGQNLIRRETPALNKELVDALFTWYEKEYQHNPESFVNISEYSSDSELRDYYFMMPEAMKNYVYNKFGKEGLWVHKSIVSTAFGFHKYSILDAFTKTKQERALLEKLIVKASTFLFKENAAKVMHNSMRVVTEVTSMAKTNIVVRNTAVIMDNYVSNLMYLKTKGVPLNMIWKQTQIAFNYGLQYQADKLEIGKLKIQLQLAELQKDPKQKQYVAKLKTKLTHYEDRLNRNPTRRFIESGGMPTMVDDVETSGSEATMYPGLVEQQFNKVEGKIPTKVQNTVNSLFLTKDKTAFKVLNNAVKMTDFVGRYVLYQYYTDETRGTARMSHVDAMRSVQDEFINFSTPTHKMLQLGNDVGFIWFSKYKLRILRVIAKSLHERPAESLSIFALAGMTGMANIFRSIPGVTQGAFQGFGTAYGQMASSVPDIASFESLEAIADITF